jgi:hypothetical protein
LFAATPKIIFSVFVSLTIFSHVFKSLKDFISSIAYTNNAIFASFVNIFVKLRYFSCPAVSHSFISYFLLLTTFILLINDALLVDLVTCVNFPVAYLVNNDVLPTFTEPIIIN